MAVSDKTRKALWGRSGNRCAICKQELVIDSTDLDDESVVGEECHIVSAAPNGPRHDTAFPQDKFDSQENLVLLCRVHHKMVDDQDETYTVPILRQTKVNHLRWVAEKLSDEPRIPKPLRFRRVEGNIPRYLTRLKSGKELLDLLTGGMAVITDHDELRSPREANLVGGFLQSVQDWLDMSSLMEPADRVSTGFNLTEEIHELEEAGFYVFGPREMQLLEGGVQDGASDWPVSIVQVVRSDCGDIVVHQPQDKKG